MPDRYFEQPKNRQQRRAEERSAEKARKKSTKVGSAPPTNNPVGAEIDDINKRNATKDLRDLNPAERDRIAELIVTSYLNQRSSPYTEQALLSSIVYHPGILPEDASVLNRGQYRPTSSLTLGSVSSQTGNIDIWLGSQPLTLDFCRRSPQLTGQTPVTIFAQGLSHELHHKGSTDPNNPSFSGFADVDHIFNEIVTEYLRLKHDQRIALNPFSWYIGITSRIPRLETLLTQTRLNEDQLFQYYNSRDYFGLCIALARNALPKEVRYIQTKKELLGDKFDEIEDPRFDKILRHSHALIELVSN